MRGHILVLVIEHIFVMLCILKNSNFAWALHGRRRSIFQDGGFLPLIIEACIW